MIIIGIILFILIGRVFFIFPRPVINIVSSISDDAGFNRGSSCPSLSKECECSGILLNEFDLLPILFRPGGGSGENYCFLGKSSDCKCYLNGCPAESAQKKEVPCDRDLDDLMENGFWP